jgi:hypothetical protein
MDCENEFTVPLEVQTLPRRRTGMVTNHFTEKSWIPRSDIFTFTNETLNIFTL